MPRNGSGVFSAPAGTAAVSGDPIASAKFNTLVADLVSDANAARPVVAGGTGATSASAARTALGVVIGTDVQAYDAGLTSIAGLTTAADKGIYATASDTYATFDLTAAGRALLDDANAAAQRTTLGLGGAALVDVIDEDSFATDSATRPPSQQSVAAYVTAQLTAMRPAIGVLNGTGTPTFVFRDGFDASVTKNSTGDYSVTFSTALADTNYVVSLTLLRNASTGDERIDLATYDHQTTGFRIISQFANTAFVDHDGIQIVVHVR